MGQEIENSQFTAADFERFQGRLLRETELLRELFDSRAFLSSHEIGGYELEAWLVGPSSRPAAVNQEFLDRLSNPLVVHELSRFNVELNSEPHQLNGRVLSLMESELFSLWQQCTDVAAAMDTRLAMMGTLPVLEDADLTTANMSAIERYRALNEQVLKVRQGHPIQLDIRGREHLHSSHCDVMLEAAATSFQIHLQIKPEHAVRYYNASVLASAPLLAVAANSPFLFGRDLWAESRIPLFEQAVNTDSKGIIGHTGRSRVTFGHDWCRDSVFEMFAENLALYPVLLPTLYEGNEKDLWHLRLHNGTIWRWNRPLIGVDQAGYHLRIEQRVVPAGPTIIDMIANAAFYYGLVVSLANTGLAVDSQTEFNQVKDDFYASAEYGLKADIHWPGKGRINVRKLLIDELLPYARSGLARLGVDEVDIKKYLGVIEARLETGQNGAHWQRRYFYTHQCSMQDMTEAYIKNQQSFRPVHEWSI